MEDFARCRRARALRESPEVTREIEDLRATPFVEYERVSALKLRFLKLAFAQFLREWRTGSARAREFRCLLRARGRPARDVRHLLRAGRISAPRRTRTSGSGPIGRSRTTIPDSRETPAFRKKHWRARHVLSSTCSGRSTCSCAGAQEHARDRHLSIGLYHDLALATDRFGSDLWAHRPFFVAGCRVGSPPDDFSPQGPGLGLSAAQLGARIARTATACSPNRSARTAATAARCASIT